MMKKPTLAPGKPIQDPPDMTPFMEAMRSVKLWHPKCVSCQHWDKKNHSPLGDALCEGWGVISPQADDYCNHHSELKP